MSTPSRQAAELGLVFVDPTPPAVVTEASPAVPSRRRRLVTPPGYVAPDSRRPHGTRAKYVLERCRCVPCTAASPEYETRRRNAMNRPDEVWAPYVSAGPARRHLRELAAQGVGLKSVAKLSGVSHGALTKLVYGDRVRGMRPSRRIRPATEAAILAVQLRHATGGQRVPGGPTWSLLDDLLARGFTRVFIAQQLLGPQARSLQLDRESVFASTAVKVREVHRRLEGVQAPSRKSRWG